jgi:protein TonB
MTMTAHLVAPRPAPGPYFDVIKHRNTAAWCGAALAAAGLTLVLFMLLPLLASSTPPPAAIGPLIPQVRVVPLRRPEPPEQPMRVTPPEVVPPKPVKPPEASRPQPLEPQLHLPFELNPRLPSGPGSLELPPLMRAPVGLTSGVGVLGGVSMGDLDAPLTPLTRMPPLYPMRAKRKGIEGWVEVKFLVDTAGTVEAVTILDAQPAEIFDRSVRRCLAGWRFKPGTVEGMAVKTWVTTTIRFELE